MTTARLFMNGRSQAVRLPKAFRFEGDEVRIRRVGRSVILSPISAGWDDLFDALEDFDDDFSIDREQPTVQPRPSLFD